ncbi:DUF3499 domain-containing protein [Brachybacterium saurashtrense]|uniref:DUF3499 domain-containing protein n=1 Tax=Brachybacterium saurashtrense TaxID=556288 RepID=UPI001B866B5A|nr:DUF3499 domain-containing protein [Brachybacterium saurashtrense]
MRDVPARECSRTACSRPAVSSLTFVYQDSTAVLGPLSRASEPHAYDLCREHASRMTAPRGWELLRVAGGEQVSDDLVALADAVGPRAEAPAPQDAPAGAGPRRAGRGQDGPGRDRAAGARRGADETARSGPRHLHVVRSTHD